jgi:hypothetical protein
MKELSIEQMEMVKGGTKTTNNCSNVGNGIAMGSFIVSGIALATGPVGWLALAGFSLSFGGVVTCQLGYA